MHTHTLSYTHRLRKHANIYEHKYAHRFSRALTHTQAHTNASCLDVMMMILYLFLQKQQLAMDATAVHTLFSSYAHTIILLC
jgi:hypothetical protein